MSERFLKSARILKSRDFKATLNRGRKVVGKNFVLFFDNAAGDSARIGLIVSKRVGNAVARNRVKRIIREWYRKSTDRPECDLVVLARSEASEYSSQELTSELKAIRKRLRFV